VGRGGLALSRSEPQHKHPGQASLGSRWRDSMTWEEGGVGEGGTEGGTPHSNKKAII
jgi:hypothetical protein